MNQPIQNVAINSLNPPKHYGFEVYKGVYVVVHPSPAEVQAEIQAGHLEVRDYSTRKAELHLEWHNSSNGNILEEWFLQKQYHARRIGYFMQNGWQDPIAIDQDRNIHDGTHRIWAALYLGRTTTDVVVKH